MVRPTHFGSNPLTMESNSFQAPPEKEGQQSIRKKAVAEWEKFVELLTQNGINVIQWEDHEQALSPDSVFPNNWISFHEGGEMIIYPMFAANRRLERRRDITDHFSSKYGFKLWDFASPMESQEKYLEGTGSMILDRINKVAYACVSPRTSPEAFDHWVKKMGYKGLIFQAVDQEGVDIYHTNVMMALGKKLAIVCLEAIPDPISREALINNLKNTGHKLVAITLEQMASFAGNMLEVANQQGEALLVMSRQAYDSLSEVQLREISSHVRLLVPKVDTIEKYGGGSVRCMMAEVFL